jgi:hypothetical protein
MIVSLEGRQAVFLDNDFNMVHGNMERENIELVCEER